MKAINEIDEVYETYKDWDMSKAKRGNSHPMIRKLQEAKANHEQALRMMDSDVLALISEHSGNAKDMERLNTMVRVLFS